MKNRTKPSRSFASDNNAGVHPRILRAIAAANKGHVVAYGDDGYTQAAVKKFREHLGKDVAVFFVFGGALRLRTSTSMSAARLRSLPAASCFQC